MKQKIKISFSVLDRRKGLTHRDVLQRANVRPIAQLGEHGIRFTIERRLLPTQTVVSGLIKSHSAGQATAGDEMGRDDWMDVFSRRRLQKRVTVIN